MSSLSREFLLVAACCRWPLSEAAIAVIRRHAAAAIDWACLLRLVQRHRVAGLVHNALSSAEIELPPRIAEALASQARHVARRSLALTAETIRLQRAFDTAKIPVVTLKGIALAQLAYGSLTLKQGHDIDLLVAPECAPEALQLLEREGYALRRPALSLNTAQRRALVRFARDVEVARRADGLAVELHWRLSYSPVLLKGIDASAPTQDVSLSSGGRVRTLASEELFAYLCVHGAEHFWFRLKWLADLNALLSARSDAEIERLYRFAAAKGAALCAGQALLLRQQLLGAKLPSGIAAELQDSGRLAALVAAALNALTGPEPHTDTMSVMREAVALFLLGRGPAFFLRQCLLACFSVTDAILLPLPPALDFLYPILRLPLWLWRRAGRLAAGKLTHTGRKADSAAHD
jgi:hypothetical protein